MMSKFKQLLIQNYFGRQFPLDYRVYMIFFFESYFISILSATTNTMLKKGILGLVLQWSYIIFCTALIFVLPRIRLAFEKPHLLFITFIYIPFLYFQTAGYDGTALLFAQLGIFMLGIVFSGKTRIIVIFLNVCNYLACIMISYRWPQTVTPHGNPKALVIDLVVGLVLSFTGLIILTAYITKVFSDNSNTLAELSIRDALTGLYNRRFLDDYLQRELDTARETGNKIYVLMLDIDHFKKINDTYGHGFGDHVLLACAQAMQSTLRKCDVVARYGGEEFAIIINPPTFTRIGDVAERIRQNISSLRFRYDVTVTVSIGIAESSPDDTIEEILTRADQYMYKAKQNGRNQVVAGNMTMSLGYQAM